MFFGFRGKHRQEEEEKEEGRRGRRLRPTWTMETREMSVPVNFFKPFFLLT